MAFDDLTNNQHQLVIRLVEELASGKFASEFMALATLGRGWFITLFGIGGANNKDIEGFEETYLYALSAEGYITLIPKQHGYSCSLKPKAYEQYKLYKLPKETMKHLDNYQIVEQKASLNMTFDEAQLERIAASSKDLLEELSQNYSLSRSQAATWFRWTLIVSVFGLVLLGVGIALVFTQQTTTATVNSIGGILAEFLALVFFKQASAANQRQDQYHRDLLRRQQILDAVQLAKLISQEQDRNRITEDIIKTLLGVNQRDSDTAQTIGKGN